MRMNTRHAVSVVAVAALLSLGAPAVMASTQNGNDPPPQNPASGTKLTELPPYEIWQADVTAALADAGSYLEGRVALSAANTAIVLDIDNTALASAYAPGQFDFQYPANPPVFALAKRAHELGVAVMFVTGRPENYRMLTQINLATVGYPVDKLVMRQSSFGTLGQYKSAARADIEKLGYTIIINVGNNTTDIEGGHAERAYKLPDYDGLLS